MGEEKAKAFLDAVSYTHLILGDAADDARRSFGGVGCCGFTNKSRGGIKAAIRAGVEPTAFTRARLKPAYDGAMIGERRRSRVIITIGYANRCV